MAGFVINNDGKTILEKHLTRLTALSGNRTAQTAYITSVSPPPVAKSVVEKHAETMATVHRRVQAILKAASVETVDDAWREVFKADRDLYDAYRKASYATAPLPQPARDGMQKAGVVSVAYQQAVSLALQMKKDDVYGKYGDKSEDQMLSLVFEQRPDLYRAYRDEMIAQK